MQMQNCDVFWPAIIPQRTALFDETLKGATSVRIIISLYHIFPIMSVINWYIEQ